MSPTEESQDETLRDTILCCYCASERSPLPTVATEGEMHIVRYANPAFCSLAGKPNDDLIGHAFADVVPDAEQNLGVSILDNVYHTGQPEIVTEPEHPVARRNEIYWSYAAWALLDKEQHPAGVMIQATDVTETTLIHRQYQKANEEIREINQELLIATIREQELAAQAMAAEQQLLQARKMESIGRLAGGIAHDFNNLLTAILGFTELAEETLAPEDEVQGYLSNIRTAAERAAGLTSQLLAFARKQVIKPKIVDLNLMIFDIDQMLRRLVGEHIELVILPTPNLGMIMADPGQLGQVLTNLVVNARDAMPQGGKITIETANVTVSAEDTHRNPELAPGDYVLLTVSDTGNGIAEEMLPHLFEPFFTTKGQGKGTGLGLATCHGIVTQSGGQILHTSRQDQGTTFSVYLPRVEEPNGAADAQPREHAARPKGTEIICFVEDEEMIREIGAATLRRQGYTVLEAANGGEALRLIHAYPEKIDLVVTDMVMPQMGGKELADQLRKVRPNVKVLFISGYTNAEIVHQETLKPGFGFLQKPFTAAALAQKVREALDGAAEEIST
jgi:PAS domain S-box-containing protein